VLFFADAGIRAPDAAGHDPFATLDDLMTVIDALCPRWPPREPFWAEGSSAPLTGYTSAQTT